MQHSPDRFHTVYVASPYKRCFDCGLVYDKHGFFEKNNKWLPKVSALYISLENIDHDTASHCLQTALLVRDFSEYLTQEGIGLTHDDIDKLVAAALLHDIGKTNPAILRIVSNGRKITQEEKLIVQKHPVIGSQMLANNGLHELSSIVLQHHEYWDGSGYPEGLSGDAIDILVRILTICDEFAAQLDPARTYNGGEKNEVEALDDMNLNKYRYDRKLLNHFFDFRLLNSHDSHFS